MKTEALVLCLLGLSAAGILDQSRVDILGLSKVNSRPYICCELQSFSQPIESYRGYQYLTYYDTLGNVCVARRHMPDTTWDTLRIADYKFVTGDYNDANGHNTPLMGISTLDGTLHLAFDHHGGALHYCVSVKNAASHPDSFAWNGSLFGPVRSNIVMPGIGSVTYPAFVRRPDGILQFICRVGGSPNGDWRLWEYQSSASRWDSVGMFLSREGDYVCAPGDTATHRCAYPNDYTYHGNRLHLSWCWREPIVNGFSTNHDLLYAYSDDFGRTWRGTNGDSVGATGGNPMKVTTPGILVWNIPVNRGYINQCAQNVDSKGRVHVVNWHVRDGDPDVPGQFFPAAAWYFHYWRDPAGAWHRDSLFPVTSVTDQARPKLVFDDSDNVFLVTKPGLVYGATAASNWSDWRQVVNEDIGRSQWGSGGEASVDFALWNSSRVISMASGDQHVLDAAVSNPSWPLVCIETRNASDHSALAGVATAFYIGDTLIRGGVTDATGALLLRMPGGAFDLTAFKAGFGRTVRDSLILGSASDTTVFTIDLLPLAETGLEIIPGSLVMKVQDSTQLQCRVVYFDGSRSRGGESYAWVSLTPELADVSAGGMVRTPDRTGEAVIVVSLASLGFSDTLRFPVARLLTLSPVADAYVTDERPDSNYGLSPEMRVTDTRWGYHRHGFIRFDIRGLEGLPVLSAVLRLYLTGGGGDSLYRMPIWQSGGVWTETGLTWNNAPSADAPVDTAVISPFSQWVSWDVTPWALAPTRADSAGFCLSDPARQNCVANFASRENADAALRPRLEVLYQDSGATGVNGHPSLEPQSLEIHPNPFNPSVHIRLAGIRDKAEVRIFSAAGRLVSSLEADKDGVEWNASSMPSGLYLIEIKADKMTLRTKAVLLK